MQAGQVFRPFRVKPSRAERENPPYLASIPVLLVSLAHTPPAYILYLPTYYSTYLPIYLQTYQPTYPATQTYNFQATQRPTL